MPKCTISMLHADNCFETINEFPFSVQNSLKTWGSQKFKMEIVGAQCASCTT